MAYLYDRVVAFANLHQSYLAARKCKRYRHAVLKFGFSLEENLLALKRELGRKTYQHGGYREFTVVEAKMRTIKAAPFRDRVVHHALCNVIEPIFERGFIFDSYACRKGKGTHAAVRRLEKFIHALRSSTEGGAVYCLKCDVSKYFDSINHDVLRSLIQKKIRDKDVIWLCDTIIASNAPGIPIGNLTSQLFANVYLNELDYFVKRVLHERYYVRYMDDFLILGVDKKRLREDKESIRAFLKKRLQLQLHPKKAEIFPCATGVDFLGYVVRDGKRLLRKTTVKRFLKRQKRMRALRDDGGAMPPRAGSGCAAWRGYTHGADAYMLLRRLSCRDGR